MADPSEPRTDQPGPTWLEVLVFLLIVAGLALTAFFGIRLMRTAQQLHHARQVPQLSNVALIRGWMTIPYIARAYRVPEGVLWTGLGIPEANNRHKNLRTLDQEFAGGQPNVILNKVMAIVSQYEAQHPATPVPPVFPPPAPTRPAP